MLVPPCDDTMTNPFEIKGQTHIEEDFRRAIEQKKLLEVEFNVSPICNLGCGFCYTDSNSKRDTGEASLNDVDTFLEQAVEAGAKTVRIVGVGEPFLDKRILDDEKFPFFELAKKWGITTVVYTNGTMIDLELAYQLFDYDVSIVTKLYSFSPEVFEQMTGERGYFSRERQESVEGRVIPKSLMALIEAGFNKDSPTRLGINNVITRQNIGEVKELYEFARLTNLAVRFSAILRGRRTSDHRTVVTPDELLAVYTQLIQWEKNYSGYLWEPHGEILGGECSRLGFNLTLDGERYQICAGCISYLKDDTGKPLTLHNTTIRQIVQEHPLFQKIRAARSDGIRFNCVMSEALESKVGCYNG